MSLPGAGELEGEWQTLMATTLGRLMLGLRPFWGTGDEPVRATAVRVSPARLWKNLLPLLYGWGERPDSGEGYYSARMQTLELWLDGDFIIDGELYHAHSREGPLSISAEARIAVLDPGQQAP